MIANIYDESTGEVIATVDSKTMTQGEQVEALKAALLDAMQVVGWAKPYWFWAIEGKKGDTK